MISRNDISSEVENIFKVVFNDNDLVISDSTDSNDIEDWDSLEHINLIVAMEKRFNLKFNISEVSELKNVGEMINLIQRKLEKQEDS
jgi:acyl carrier protein